MFPRHCVRLHERLLSTWQGHPKVTPHCARLYATENKPKQSGWQQWEGVVKRFVPLGLCLIAVMQWRSRRRKMAADDDVARSADRWQVNVYCCLPLRSLSRFWGYLAGWQQWEGIVKRFVPLGLCLIAVMQWRSRRRKMAADDDVARSADRWQVNVYCCLPLRSLSRFWGYLADKELPEFARPLVYETYARAFGANLAEAEHADLRSYPSLAAFFARRLRDGARVVDRDSCVVAPCDGTVLSVGTVNDGRVEQVKGVTYYVQDFLGERGATSGEERAHHRLLRQPQEGHALYQCVIYLAPGDYHRFHSPADWTPTRRRHFDGELLSVNPRVVKWLPNLFVLNERAVYLGTWQHGFFSYSAVGATNVGSIRVYFDSALRTNQKRRVASVNEARLAPDLRLRKGDLVGEFRMGSTIVVIFEAPATFAFDVAQGERVLMGQRLGMVGTTSKRGETRRSQVGG